MGQIIGITGAIGSGKSTFAGLLRDMEPSHAAYESGELIAEVAEDFNRALSGELAFETTTDDVELVNQALIWFIESISERLHQDVTWNQLAITKHQIATNPELFTKMFAYVDTAKQQPDILDHRITNENKETYRPILQWIGGYLIAKISSTIWYDEIFRRIDLHDNDKSIVTIGGVRTPEQAQCVRNHQGIIISIERAGLESDDSDVTEATRREIVADITIVNNGTIEQLAAVAETVWNDLVIGKPKSEYIAA